MFFRAETRNRAGLLGLAGWVRNNADGTVEAAFEGDRDKVESMVEWCRRGPAHAEVYDIDGLTPVDPADYDVIRELRTELANLLE